jgi:uncharacterized protein with GYD domain
MATFVMLTRLHPGAFESPASLETLEKQAMKRIDSECPSVKWIHNYAILGPWDYLDIFEAPDIETAAKVSALIRSFGHAHTEMWTATEWSRFKMLVRGLGTAKGRMTKVVAKRRKG